MMGNNIPWTIKTAPQLEEADFVVKNQMLHLKTVALGYNATTGSRVIKFKKRKKRP